MTRDTFSLIVSLLGTIAGIFSIVVSYLTIGVESDKKKKQWYWVVFIIIIFITLANGIFIQSYDFRNEYDCMNSTDALVEAERYYVIGDYVYAAMIYESDSLRSVIWVLLCMNHGLCHVINFVWNSRWSEKSAYKLASKKNAQ